MVALPVPTARFHPVVNPSGPRDAALAVVGDVPDWYDQQAGRPFSGPTGRLLDATLLRAGVARGNVYAAHVVSYRVTDEQGEDLPPTASAILLGREILLADLDRVRPRIVLACGAVAAKALLGTTSPLSEIEGVVEHVPGLCCPVLPTWHPGVVLREGDAGKFEDLLSSATRAVAIAEGRTSVPPRDETIPWSYVHRPLWGTALALLDQLLAGQAGHTLAIDVETDGLDVVSGALLQVAIGNHRRGVVFEADLLKQPPVVGRFRELMADGRFTWVIHNSSFDLQWLDKHFGVVPANVIDTMCLALGTTERGEAVGLKKLSRHWLNAPYYEANLHTHLPTKDASWSAIPPAVLAEYAAKDVVYTARMLPLLEEMVLKEGTRGLAYDLLMPAQRAFAKIEARGILVDQEYLAHLEEIWAPKVEESLRALQDYAHAQGWRRRKLIRRVKHERFEPRYHKKTGKPIKDKRIVDVEEVWANDPLNPRSPSQLCEFLFDHLKLRPPGGERTTGQKFRDAYPHHDFTRLHADFQLMSRMLNTYVRGIKRDIRADGRVHPSFALFGAVTGRLAMHHPPLQTIPREGTVNGRFGSIKRMFLPSPGHVWMEVDFKQLEVRVAWHLSEDEGLGQAITSRDFHLEMAHRITGLPKDEITKEQRHASKRVSFGIMYGRGAAAIADQLTAEGTPTTPALAQEYIDNFFAAAPRYHAWYRRQIRQALSEGRSTTPFGRVRRWNLLVTEKDRSHLRNQAVNFPVQAVASDLTLTALIKLTDLLPARGLGHTLLTVHDSICAEIHEDRVAEAVALVREVMTTWPWESCAVLDVEASVGPSWGEVEEWNG